MLAVDRRGVKRGQYLQRPCARGMVLGERSYIELEARTYLEKRQEPRVDKMGKHRRVFNVDMLNNFDVSL